MTAGGAVAQDSLEPSEPDRILLVAPSAVAGGMEDILANLCVGLPNLGLAPEVVSLQDGPLVDRLIGQGTPAAVVAAGRMRDAHRFARTAREIGVRLRRARYRAVISNLPKAHLYTAIPAVRSRVPALWFQGGYPDPAHWIDRLASALPAQGVIALSRDAAAAQHRLNRRRTVHMMHPGIDLSRFHVGRDPELRARFGIPSEKIVVSLVGRLQPWKGQREFLQAAAIISRTSPEAHFAIVGGAILGWEGNYPAEVRELAQTLGLEDRVTFTGHTDEVDRWMRASDIMVNASAPEPFGLVVIEAMAAGCPVVAVADGGPRDIIEDGQTGVLCSTREPQDLAAGINRLLDAKLRASVGPAARRRVEDQFSREEMARRFAAIVDTAAPKRSWS